MKEYTQFTMRIDNDVYAMVKEDAERFKRSIAKEIEYILEQWCKARREAPSEEEIYKIRAIWNELYKDVGPNK